MDLSFDAVMAKVAGIAGAVVSLKFVQGTWPERVMMALSGSLFSYYASPLVAERTGMPEGLAGFLLGLFGMAVVGKAWEVIQVTPIAEFWKIGLDLVKKRLGM